MAPPIYAMTPAEGVALRELYGLEKVAQLFPIDDIMGKSDLSKDCTYPEAMVQRDPGLIIKCRALRKEVGGRGGFVHASPYKVTEILEKGKFSYFYRRIKRQEHESTINCPQSYKSRIKDGYAVPPPWLSI